ncbi:MAG: 30S ribosomal protein S27ae [Nitrososphaerales archaeon]
MRPPPLRPPRPPEQRERARRRRLYKVEDSGLTRLKKECPRCGKGYFMAEHKDRMSCGNCGYTTFKTKA